MKYPFRNYAKILKWLIFPVFFYILKQTDNVSRELARNEGLLIDNLKLRWYYNICHLRDYLVCYNKRKKEKSVYIITVLCFRVLYVSLRRPFFFLIQESSKWEHKLKWSNWSTSFINVVSKMFSPTIEILTRYCSVPIRLLWVSFVLKRLFPKKSAGKNNLFNKKQLALRNITLECEQGIKILMQKHNSIKNMTNIIWDSNQTFT